MVRFALSLALLAAGGCSTAGRLASDPFSAERELVAAGKPAEAAARLTLERLARTPKRFRGDGHVLLAHSLEAAGRIGDALAAYQYAEGLFPKNLEVVSGLAWLLHRQGLDDRARPLFERIVRIHPNNSSGNIGLGEILRSDGDLAGAQACYDRALSEKGWSENASVLRDYAELLSARQDFAAAALAIGRALALGRAPETLLAAARIDRRRGRGAEAEARLAEALSLDAGLDEAVLQRALWALEDGRLEAAAADAEAVLGRKDDALARWVRGVVRARRGDIPGARADLASAAADRRAHPFVSRAALALLEELHAPAD